MLRPSLLFFISMFFLGGKVEEPDSFIQFCLMKDEANDGYIAWLDWNFPAIDFGFSGQVYSPATFQRSVNAKPNGFH